MSVLNCAASVLVNWNVAETLALGFGSGLVTDDVEPSFNFTPGTGAGEVDLHWEQQGVVIAPGALQTYQLSALVDSLGRTVNFATVCGILVAVTNRVPGDRLGVGHLPNSHGGTVFGSPVLQAWGTPFDSVNGGVLVYGLFLDVVDQSDGWAVLAGAADTLPVKSYGVNSITYNIAFIGRSV